MNPIFQNYLLCFISLMFLYIIIFHLEKSMQSNLELTSSSKIHLFSYIISKFYFTRFNIQEEKHQGTFPYADLKNLHQIFWFLQTQNIVHDKQSKIQRENSQTQIKANHSYKTFKFGPFMKNNPDYKNMTVHNSAKLDFPERIKRSTHIQHQSQKIQNYSGSFRPSVKLKTNIVFQNQEFEAQDYDVIQKFRWHKKRKYDFHSKHQINDQKLRSKIMEDNLTEIKPAFKKNQKKQKLKLLDHFVDMKIQIKEEQPLEAKQSVRNYIKSSLSLKKKKSSRSKDFNINSFIQRQKHELIRPTSSRHILNIPNKLKLTHGVALTQNIQKVGKEQSFHNKKQFQFLKNRDLEIVKIKINDLISYKKIQSNRHLNYCSSMKTLKDFNKFKNQTNTNISIQSRQNMYQQKPAPKKLVKIVNRKIFDEIFNENEFINQKQLKTQFKGVKKQNKVRFDKQID